MKGIAMGIWDIWTYHLARDISKEINRPKSNQQQHNIYKEQYENLLENSIYKSTVAQMLSEVNERIKVSYEGSDITGNALLTITKNLLDVSNDLVSTERSVISSEEYMELMHPIIDVLTQLAGLLASNVEMLQNLNNELNNVLSDL